MTLVRSPIRALLILPLLFAGGACATIPETQGKRSALLTESAAALDVMRAHDPGLDAVLEASAGYAIFPHCGKGGLIVGGAFGRGVVYDAARGDVLGYATITQASVGGVIGARSYALLLVFDNEAALADFREGDDMTFGSEATAIALTEGVSATTPFHDGVAVFALPRGGLMADASLSGQSFRFEPPPSRDVHPATATTALPMD